MTPGAVKLYRKLRSEGYRAAAALRCVKIRARWFAASGYLCGNGQAERWTGPTAIEPGWVRIVEHPDQDPFDASYIDTWEDVPEAKRETEKAAILERAARDGVWGYVAEVFDGEEWTDVDSIWGFVGDDFTQSGYYEDLMAAALDELPAMQRKPALYPA